MWDIPDSEEGIGREREVKSQKRVSTTLYGIIANEIQPQSKVHTPHHTHGHTYTPHKHCTHTPHMHAHTHNAAPPPQQHSTHVQPPHKFRQTHKGMVKCMHSYTHSPSSSVKDTTHLPCLRTTSITRDFSFSPAMEEGSACRLWTSNSLLWQYLGSEHCLEYLV